MGSLETGRGRHSDIFERDVRLPPVVLLMGPTATGKSALALALARQFPAEIVSVDSAQVYRGMDIGTAKPDVATRHGTPHHLIDLIAPTAAYSVAQFVTDADQAIRDIRDRGKVPLLVGGTMLYFKALREGLSDLPRADYALREALDRRAAREGWPALHAELARVDDTTAARLSPFDAQRIGRALEVFALTGTALSRLHGSRRSLCSLGPMVSIALMPTERTRLHRQIAERFDVMLRSGLVEELRALRESHVLAPGLPSMRCVGYRQAWSFLDGEINAAELREKGIAATRQLAKRQFTWLRAMPASSFDPWDAATLPAIGRLIAASIRV